MSYNKFLEAKQKRIIESGFKVQNLNENLFDFQEFIVKRALLAGKYAILADTGLGKTIMQLSWANQVVKHTNRPVLIPKIGMLLFLTKDTALRSVPSPPILTKISALSFKSS